MIIKHAIHVRALFNDDIIVFGLTNCSSMRTARDTIIIYFIRIYYYLFIIVIIFFLRPLQNNVTIVGLHYHNFMRVRHTPSHLFLHTSNIIIYTSARVCAPPIALIQTSVSVNRFKMINMHVFYVFFFFLFIWL